MSVSQGLPGAHTVRDTRDDSILDVAGWAPTLPAHTPGTFELLDLLEVDRDACRFEPFAERPRGRLESGQPQAFWVALEAAAEQIARREVDVGEGLHHLAGARSLDRQVRHLAHDVGDGDVVVPSVEFTR